LARHADLGTIDWALDHGLRIVAIVAIALVVSWMAGQSVRRMRRRLDGTESVTQELDLTRSATLTTSLSSAIRVLIWTVAVLLVLGEFGMNLAPLLAGAGVAGVALGFGAQSLVKDFLSGFFILLEQQFGVGQVITLNTEGGTVEGKVESMSLRVTALRAFDGTLHVVPNGNILLVGNQTRGWARAIVDVSVDYEEDLATIRELLDELFDELRDDEDLRGGLFSGPEVLGIERLGDQEVVLRVVAQTKPSRRPDMERELRRRIKERFDARGVRVPPGRRVLVSSERPAE
jgi:small conductance mechanosensitive channel